MDGRHEGGHDDIGGDLSKGISSNDSISAQAFTMNPARLTLGRPPRTL
jgi:hypothetical protein